VTLCPCGSGDDFADCCGPLIDGVAPAPSAEALMRARYTAHVLRNLDYVDRTHAPEVRDDFNRAEAQRLADECEWKGLHIHSAREADDIAEIEFIVQFLWEQKLVKKGAVSRFRRDNGQWYFVSSKPAHHLSQRRMSKKIGRNDPCSCNSGKKFKKCCGAPSELHGA
jgi:SEC-C motif domain protein